MALNTQQVLIIAGHFYPGFRAGGPPKSLYNLITSPLTAKFSFTVLTRDRDVGSYVPYEGFDIGRIRDKLGPSHQIIYATPSEFGFISLLRLLRSQKFQLIYLNSFFGFKHSILPLFLVSILRPASKFLIAPRGEFYEGALSLKAFKKRLFLYVFRRFYQNRQKIVFHATNLDESLLLQSKLGIFPNNIYVAPNLPSVFTPERLVPAKSPLTSPVLEIIFVSRITPKKNLLFLIRCLKLVVCNLNLSVYGPIRDEHYWLSCQKEINTLPPNVYVSYLGELPPSEVAVAFSRAHLFVFPTLGENYGHVIAEALSAWTPVLLSDQTPWRETFGGGISVLRGFSEKVWAQKISEYSLMGDEKWKILSDDARMALTDDTDFSSSLEAYELMFRHFEDF